MNKLQWNLYHNSNIFIHENAFESVVCEMATILPRSQCVKMPLRCSYYIRHVGCCSLLRIYVVIWIFPVRTTCKMYYICTILIQNNMSIAKIKCCITPMTTWYITFEALQIWIKTRTSFCYQLNLDKYNDRNYICNCKSCCIILKCFFICLLLIIPRCVIIVFLRCILIWFTIKRLYSNLTASSQQRVLKSN